MSFLRHPEIYRSDVLIQPLHLGSRGAVRGPLRGLIVSMSFRLAIPWRVALQQSPPPLRQPRQVCDMLLWRTTVCQPTVTCPSFLCLTEGAQCRPQGVNRGRG